MWSSESLHVVLAPRFCICKRPGRVDAMQVIRQVKISDNTKDIKAVVCKKADDAVRASSASQSSYGDHCENIVYVGPHPLVRGKTIFGIFTSRTGGSVRQARHTVLGFFLEAPPLTE